MSIYLMQRYSLVMADKPFSEYAERNAAPILDVLALEFANSTAVLEIGAGTGQHAARFAAALPHLRWQSSDLDANHAGINAWVEDSGLDNLPSPLSLDVRAAGKLTMRFDAAYSANTAHIMSFDTVKKMFSLLGTTLDNGGVFCLYGPFRQGGEFNTESNAAFHRSLRSRDAAMGIRHLEALDELGESNGLSRIRLYAMPANNHLAVWQKERA